MNPAKGLMLALALLPLSALGAGVTASAADGLRVSFSDDATLRISGRLQADSVSFDDDITSLENDEDFRRARLSSRLDLGDWRGVASYDFGVADGWKLFYLQYRGFERQRITAGNQVAAFSLEDNTSSRNLPLLERSVASALAPGLLTGVAYNGWGKRWTARVGVYGNELSNLDRRIMDGTSLMSRVTFAPVRERNAIVHLGFAGEYRWLDDNNVRLRARPGTRLTRTRLVDTRSIEGADLAVSGGLELAASYRNFRLQTEAMQMRLDRDVGAGDVDFKSQYLMATMLLGGERYRYSRASGTYRDVRPRSGWGSVELAARIARLDLSDGDIEGGEQTELTLGLGWTVTEQIRLMVNYTDIQAEPNRNGIDEDLSLVSLRLQYSM